MQVSELMTRNVLSCRPSDTLARAAQLMWEGDIGAVPITDEQDKLVGILTDRDICMAAYTRGCLLGDCRVEEVMAREVQSCEPGDSSKLAEEKMREHQIHRLPVIEADKLVGMLSLNDLALAAGNRKPSKGNALSFESIATTLARICAHRGTELTAAAQ